MISHKTNVLGVKVVILYIGSGISISGACFFFYFFNNYCNLIEQEIIGVLLLFDI